MGRTEPATCAMRRDSRTWLTWPTVNFSRNLSIQIRWRERTMWIRPKTFHRNRGRMLLKTIFFYPSMLKGSDYLYLGSSDCNHLSFTNTWKLFSLTLGPFIFFFFFRSKCIWVSALSSPFDLNQFSG